MELEKNSDPFSRERNIPVWQSLTQSPKLVLKEKIKNTRALRRHDLHEKKIKSFESENFMTIGCPSL
jgi:hypothetical protein